MNDTEKLTLEEAALIEAEDLGGDALAYFLTGFKRGSIWQSQQPNEELERYKTATENLVEGIAMIMGMMPEIKREYFHAVIWLEKFENVKYICEANLMLKEVLQFLEQLDID